MTFKTLQDVKRWADDKFPVYIPFEAIEMDVNSKTLPKDILVMMKDGVFHYFKQEDGFELLMTSNESLVEGK